METVSANLNLPGIDQRVLAYWKEAGAFKASLERRKNAPQYLFYDGPPFSSGLPHHGHLLAGTIKDIIPRYQTMKGFYVERRFGWDTHGLPIEMIIERELGLNGRSEIIAYGIDRFNEACRAGVLRYVKEWEQVTTRLGRWVDFEHDYKTMDVDFMESVWWVFKQLWDKGRIYEGSRVVPYSWRLSTPLSNFEASSNYKDVQDPAITVAFTLEEEPDTYLLAWTTTPWTLLSNMALCVGADLDYVKIDVDGRKLILAEGRLSAYFKAPEDYEVVARMKGRDLVGRRYVPLFEYYRALRERGAFRVVSDDYVSLEDGTGIVHQSPAHGEDDHRIGKREGLPIADPVDAEGRFEEPVSDFKGVYVKDADKEIIRRLKESGRLIRQDTIVHSYPFCERSDTPLIYKSIPAWYVKVEDIRDQMLANNDTIHWVPEHIRQGRFGKWLESARDWNISRNRFWGNPLPLWKCEQCGAFECVGSRRELEEKSGGKVPDLHKHFVDALHWPCTACGGQMTRIPEVLDCWFESGSMPYAQLHYPFENQELFQKVFPADFIAEGLDQTRGWFYTLMILGTTIFGKAPFKNCVVNGLILAEDGKKMSKRLKNYADPVYVMDTYGADALRLFLINSPVVKGESLRFSESGVREIVRSVLLPLWNVHSFFSTYANVDGFRPSEVLTDSRNDLDRWVLSRFQTLLAAIEREMSVYHLYAVVPNLLKFIEELTNWYVRRSRRRFWSDDAQDKQQGYNTFYYILLSFSRALAPFLPFISEEIYRNLATLSPALPASVHLCDYPVADPALIDADLERDMELIQEAVGLGRTLRERIGIKVRQPLASITVVTRNERDAEALKRYGDHIKEELNVKAVLFSSDEASLIAVTLKPNYPALGPIFGKEMRAAAAALASSTRDDIERLEAGGTVEILGRSLDLSHVQVLREAKTKEHELETARGVTVYFDTTLTDLLVSEGLAREFVNRVQRMRKEADFHVSDRIVTALYTSADLGRALQAHAEYIKSETLSLELQVLTAAPAAGACVKSTDIEGTAIDIVVSKA